MGDTLGEQVSQSKHLFLLHVAHWVYAASPIVWDNWHLMWSGSCCLHLVPRKIPDTYFWLGPFNLRSQSWFNFAAEPLHCWVCWSMLMPHFKIKSVICSFLCVVYLRILSPHVRSVHEFVPQLWMSAASCSVIYCTGSHFTKCGCECACVWVCCMCVHACIYFGLNMWVCSNCSLMLDHMSFFVSACQG